MDICVSMKVIGKRKNLIESVPFTYEVPPQTVEQLISDTVSICVRNFNKKQENGSLLSAITSDQIKDMSDIGKISFGELHNSRKANLEAAQANAILSFSDGIFRIFFDDRELTALSDTIDLSEASVLTFVRLTMLSGRLW